MALIRRIDNLVKQLNEFEMELFEDTINSFTSYINSIVIMKVKIPHIMKSSFSQKEIVEEIEKLDRNRKILHDSCIASVKMLNRICERYNIEKIFKGDVEDRQEVADFVHKLVNVYFQKTQRT